MFNRALLRVHKIQMDPIPCKREQFWIRSRVNAPQKVDHGSDPIWIPSRVNGALVFD